MALYLEIAIARQEMLYDRLHSSAGSKRSEGCSSGQFSSACSSSSRFNCEFCSDCAPKWWIIRMYLIGWGAGGGWGGWLEGFLGKSYELKSAHLFCTAEGGIGWCPEVKHQVGFLLDCLLQENSPLTAAHDHRLPFGSKRDAIFTHLCSSNSLPVWQCWYRYLLYKSDQKSTLFWPYLNSS